MSAAFFVCYFALAVLRRLRLRNFRSLQDSGDLELRPIVVLVGANSSGKSSLLRFFPLLRQTEEGRSSSPLLWFSEQGYVDFGEFKSTLFRDAEPPKITLEASLELPGRYPGDKVPCEFVAEIAANEDSSTVVAFSLTVHGDRADFVRQPDGELRLASVAGLDPAKLTALPALGAAFSSLIPEFTDPSSLVRLGKNLLVDEVWQLVHGNSTDVKLHEIAREIHHGTSPSVLVDMKNVSSSVSGVRKWEQNVEGLTPDSPRVQRIKRAAFLEKLGEYLRSLRVGWRDLALGVRYIGPFRKVPLRYYRKEAVAVREISQAGDNLAMFLWSRPQAERDAFSAWVREHFGFGVSARAEGAHVVLTIDPGVGKAGDFNLVDMGFGISQLLPVVAQCWIASREVKRPPREERLPSILAIEQPELHLHPHHQYGLADLFTSLAGAVRKAGRSMPIVIETHSEALLHRFGELVEGGRLGCDDLSVLLFHKQAGGETQVQQATFNADGVLENWPIGFFRA